MAPPVGMSATEYRKRHNQRRTQTQRPPTRPPKRPLTAKPVANPVAKPAANLVAKPAAKPPTPSKSIALLVGIEYTAEARRGTMKRLPGCSTDTKNMYAWLTTKRGVRAKDIRVLCDCAAPGNPREPSRANILAAIDWLVQRSREPTVTRVYLHYSGHGTHTRDLNNDEIDGQDEAICPSDFKSAGVLLDDTLRARLVDRLDPSCTLVAIMDCCHSGTVLDLEYRYTSETTAVPASNVPPRTDASATVVALSGCTDTQKSVSAYDLDSRRQWQGAMTWAFLRTVAQPLRSESLLESVRRMLKARNHAQWPQLCSNRRTTRRLVEALFTSS